MPFTIDLAPNFAAPHSGLAWAQLISASQFQKRSLMEVQVSAERLIRRALDLDPSDAEARACWAFALFRRGDFQGAFMEAERALATTPNLASAHHMRGVALSNLGKPEEGLVAVEAAIRLDPCSPQLPVRLDHVAAMLYQCRQYEAVITAAQRVIRSRPDHPPSYRWLAAAFGQLGRTDEAKAALDKAVAIGAASFDMYMRNRAPFWRPDDYAHMLEGLRKAGWEG